MVLKGTGLIQKVELPLIMPIPAFPIGDIDALIIYIHWHHMKDT